MLQSIFVNATQVLSCKYALIEGEEHLKKKTKEHQHTHNIIQIYNNVLWTDNIPQNIFKFTMPLSHDMGQKPTNTHFSSLYLN